MTSFPSPDDLCQHDCVDISLDNVNCDLEHDPVQIAEDYDSDSVDLEHQVGLYSVHVWLLSEYTPLKHNYQYILYIIYKQQQTIFYNEESSVENI